MDHLPLLPNVSEHTKARHAAWLAFLEVMCEFHSAASADLLDSENTDDEAFNEENWDNIIMISGFAIVQFMKLHEALRAV